MSYDDVFSFDNLFESTRKCMNGVKWKKSIQSVNFKRIFITNELYLKLKNRKFKFGKVKKFKIHGRGKVREISALNIYDRIVLKCLCDYCLVPILSKTLIHTNGACLKNKGIHFTLNNLKLHIHTFLKTHSLNDAYIVKFDISKYFQNVDRSILFDKIKKYIKDLNILEIIYNALFQSGYIEGLNLGSLVSQISALFYLNRLDHFLQRRYKFYGRYMDDGYVIVDSKQKCHEIISFLELFLNNLNLSLNSKKTQIMKLKNGFVFLKRHFKIDYNFKITIKPDKKSLKTFMYKIRYLNRVNNKELVKIVLDCLKGYLKGTTNNRFIFFKGK